jgi:putative transposase
MTRWSQFLAMATAQLSSRSSLRDVISNLSTYEQLAGKLLAQCLAHAPRHGFRFKNRLYSLDSSTIDLCLSVFPWVRFRTVMTQIRIAICVYLLLGYLNFASRIGQSM